MSFAERIKSICYHYGFHAANLFEGWEQSNRYDLEASAQKYAAVCRQALKEKYQEVDEIEVVFDTGILPQLMQTQIEVVVRVDEDGAEILEDRSDSHEADLISQVMSVLCEEIYQKKQHKWVVKREWITILQAHQRLHLPVSVIR